ncbi:uncharacterized protein LOC121790124 [Salvia splendens]|uniref:uncharacterized protein LOC121790124 n=1 Tax=Salvia splendens TaxID=180675 RepID=UPI001C26D603|nr:uncharacterized protein LOC121790124 [Salvia splendens]
MDKWKDVCRPTSEGGLGLRCMDDTVEAYSYKLWWRFREQNSLWVQQGSSPFGEGCSRLGLSAKELSDGCLEMAREGAPDFARVEDFWSNFGWMEEEIFDMLDEWGVPREVCEEILRVPANSWAKDITCWALTPHGNFTVASAWELIRHRGEKLEVYDLIWGKGINPTISVFLWRLLDNRIPVDAKVQWRRVSLASKWRCCSSSNVETRLHLFLNGEATAAVWKHFER